MRNIFTSRLGRASAIIAIAGSALICAGTTAEARDGAHWVGHLNGHWSGHGYYHAPYPAYRYGDGGWYWPYHYAPPPIVVYPPVVPPAYGYYGAPSLNFGLHVPL